MNRPVLYRFALVFLVTLVAPLSAKGFSAKSWKAGAARVDITPAQPMWMSGYAGRNKPAEGTLHPLWAKALALESPDGEKVVLITMDLVGITRRMADVVCNELAKAHKLPRRSILLATSHTHTGPVVRGNLQTMYALDENQIKLIEEYGDTLQKKLVQVATEAIEQSSPAQLSWDIGTSTFAVNRRTNAEANVPELRKQGKLKGPIDHDVPVLAVKDSAGKLKAVVFGYACHATVLSFYKWSGDYPGFAQIALEKAHPGTIALFWAGCGGDQNPLPRRTVALAEKYGNQLAKDVDAVLAKEMTPIEGNIRSALALVDLPFAELPSREKLVEDSTSSNRYIAARAKYLLAKMEKKPLSHTYAYPIQVWQLGDGPTWVSLGGEVVVDYSLRLKKEVGAKTWVTAYANDVMAYIPSRRVLKEGGYEGARSMIYYGQPTVWSPKIEELLVDGVHKLVKKVRE